MRFPNYSLKTAVVAHLSFLIVAAMLLTNVVMIKFAEKELIKARMQSGRLFLHTFAQWVEHEITGRHNNSLTDMETAPFFKKDIIRGLHLSGFSGATIFNKDGIRVFGTGPRRKVDREVLSISREAMETRAYTVRFSGTTWGVIWLAPEMVHMSVPIFCNGHLTGAATVSSNLTPIYVTLRSSEKLVLIYIFLNTVILVLFGIFLLSRTVVRPIHKLLRITEEFKDGEPFPHFVESSRNEIGRLFRSLNMMLRRLDENKKELKANVSSLEKANQDIKMAQDEIIRSEKLASLGRLATGVAHEIGNPTGIVLGYLELLRTGHLNDEEKRDFLERIESEITRISMIIRQLLDFSRPGSGEYKETSIHGLITETLTMLEPQSMMVDIKVHPVFKADRDIVFTDPNQLKQVLLNIIMNAGDAMLENTTAKRLTITTANREDSIEMRFADTGPGIQQDELDHIFDPFYTTKEPGKGTGLGLSICYRILEGLGGSIRAKSDPEQGAEMIIEIPVR